MDLKIVLLSVFLGKFGCFCGTLPRERKDVEVFLGGSCNPTSWRKEVAIPKLEKLQISYYNPQVDDWSPELMELENNAKKNAKVLLFVIDKKTRNTASIIEIIELSVTRAKSLVVVFNGFYDFNGVLTGQQISPEEFYSLNNAALLLNHFLRKSNIPVFYNLIESIGIIPKMLKSTFKTSKPTDNKSPVKWMSEETANKFTLIKLLKSNFELKASSLKSGKDCEQLKNVINRNLKGTIESFISQVSSSVKEAKISDCLSSLKFPKANKNKLELFKKDLYLGVVASEIQMVGKYFEKSGKIYQQEIEDYTADNLVEELKKIQNSKVVFISVPKNSGGLGISQLAAYLIAKSDKNLKLVLSIVNVDADSLAQSLGLKNDVSGVVKDYNRGRDYLKDFANRNGVIVFDDIAAATQYTLTLIKK